jgi:diadenosine tetraphosphate (Ap4A) HIT family hydrolase
MTLFQLDTRLASDCVNIGHFTLCTALLMKDANYPWVILVPMRADICEIFELDELDQEQLAWESSHVAKAMKRLFQADKMNIAALGNVVPQLHVHHVARLTDDPAWPNPVWGKVPIRGYTVAALQERVKQLQQALVTSTFVPNFPQS